MVRALTTMTNNPSVRSTSRPTRATMTGRAKRLASTIAAANQATCRTVTSYESDDRGARLPEREGLRRRG